MKLLVVLFITLLAYQAKTQVNVEVQPDGKKYSRILLNGSISAKYDLVFVGDGFTKADQALFNRKVLEAVDGLRKLEPYASNLCSFNIWKVNVISEQSGISDPRISRVRRTELNCRFGDRRAGEIERCIYTDRPDKCYEAALHAPSYDAVFVLVNDNEWGGCESGLVFSTIAPNFHTIVTHELGHKIGNLADEYQCSSCNASEPPRRYNGPEPWEVNITTQIDRSKIKWASSILPGTTIPTLRDWPNGVVGLFEGGAYSRTGIYRPQFTCQMENTFSPFCVVCKGEMIRLLNGYCQTR